MISIAIDGPSGVGKSTLAKSLAKELGYVHMDTGALFRSVGLYCLEHGIDIEDETAVTAILPKLAIRIRFEDGNQHVYINDVDVTGRIRTGSVSEAASVTSRYPSVRAKVLELERAQAEQDNVVMDGRDIGTVVLPQATHKLFLTARPEVQARRRYLEWKQEDKLNGATEETILADLMERDYRDSHRKNAPLCKAEDAREIDTSDLSAREVLELALEICR